jgi:hypothetical protein
MTALSAIGLVFTAVTAHPALAGPTQAYHAHGVAFRYPAGMTVNTQVNSGVSTIIIKGSSGDPTTLTVQVCPPVLSRSEANRMFMQGMRIGIGSSGHLGSPVSATMRVAGTVRSGQRYPLTVAGLPFAMELYSFNMGGDVLNVAAIRPNTSSSARAAGEADFATVAGSLHAQH